MAMWLKCDRCKKDYRYDESDMENLGTFWHPILSVNCQYCGNEMKHDYGKQEYLDDLYMSRENEGISFKPKNLKGGLERAKISDIREFWIQEYVKKNYINLGIKDIEGPFEIGPDFIGIYNSSRIKIEVERDCECYVKHNHHKDEKFKDVKLLIVLNPSKPSSKTRKYLPKKIIYIDVEHFVKWWGPLAKRYANHIQLNLFISVLSKEFQNRFLMICDSKNRELATCPVCSVCPYFSYNSNEKVPFFDKIALKFVIQFKENIDLTNFHVSSIDTDEINKFFFDYILKYTL